MLSSFINCEHIIFFSSFIVREDYLLNLYGFNLDNVVVNSYLKKMYCSLQNGC